MSHFKPEKGQYYWMLNSRFKVVWAIHTGSKKSNDRIAAGNAFKNQLGAYILLGHIKLKTEKKWWQIWL